MESKDSKIPQNQKLAPLKKNNKDNCKFSRARNVGGRGTEEREYRKEHFSSGNLKP